MKEKYILASAPWCEPCKSIKRLIASDKIEVEIKDAEDDPQFFVDNNIKSVPTLLVFDENDLPLERLVGLFDIVKKFK